MQKHLNKKNQEFRAPALAIQLAEDDFHNPEIPAKIQLLREGDFSHPDYGNFKIDRAVLDAMVRNFQEKVRGVDLSVDYGHASDREAAAWIQELTIEEDEATKKCGLFASVTWTPPGKQSLANKEYRYLSADFTFAYVDAETNKAYGPVLFGAGLTNRPFIKNMAPAIGLSEGKGDQGMDPKDKEIADLKAQIAELQSKLAAKGEKVEVAAGEDEEKKKLSDELKAANDKIAAYAKKEEEDKKSAALAEKKSKFDVALTEGRVVEAQRDAFMAGDMMKFTELAQGVKLSEQGHGKDTDHMNGVTSAHQAQKKILELAQTKAAAEKMALSDAVSIVRKENPDLVKAATV